MESDVHPRDVTEDMTGENMDEAEININSDTRDTCNGNVSEHSQTTTDIESSSESVNSDSEAYVYHDGFFKAKPLCTEPESENYKALYEDTVRQLMDLESRFRTSMENLNSKYDKEKEEHQILQDKFASTNEKMKIDFEVRKVSFENAIEDKEKQIVSQRKTIQEYDEKLCLLVTTDSEKGIPCIKLRKHKLEDMFRMKPKRSGSTKNLQLITCKGPACESSNVNMIKCNICLKFVCEECNGVQVAKLKAIMDKCSNIYFICKCCNDKAPIINDKTHHISIGEEDIDTKVTKFTTQLLGTVNKIVEDKLSMIESKFISLVKIPEEINQNCKTFKDALAQNIPSATTTVDLKRIINETRNKELVQERERKLRSLNIIIHGANEETENGKDSDERFISAFLETLGVTSKPESIVRLGTIRPEKIRPLKLKMRSVEDKCFNVQTTKP